MILYILIWAVTWLKKKGTITIKRCNFRINSSTQRKTSRGKMKKKKNWSTTLKMMSTNIHFSQVSQFNFSRDVFHIYFIVVSTMPIIIIISFFPPFFVLPQNFAILDLFLRLHSISPYSNVCLRCVFFRTEKRESIRANETISKILHFILKDNALLEQCKKISIV